MDEKEEALFTDKYMLQEALKGMLERLEGQTDIDSYDMMALEPNVDATLFAGNQTRVRICFLIQVVAPFFVGAHIISLVVAPDEDDKDQSIQWANLCQVDKGWHQWMTKIMNKAVGMSLLLYMFNYLEGKSYAWDAKPTQDLLLQGKIFSFLEEPQWCGIGQLANGLALCWSGLVSIAVIYYSETPLDIVLNSLALFFLIEIDDQLLDKYDYERNLETFKQKLDVVSTGGANDDTENVSLISYPHFARPLTFVTSCISTVKLLVLASTIFIAVCK